MMVFQGCVSLDGRRVPRSHLPTGHEPDVRAVCQQTDGGEPLDEPVWHPRSRILLRGTEQTCAHAAIKGKYTAILNV